jgi:hypothetical protein
MADRKKKLIQALEGMIRQFPHYYDEEVVSRLLTDRSLPNRDEKLLAALVDLVDGCLDRRDDGLRAFLDGTSAARARPASVDAVTALADFGLIRIIPRSSSSSDDGHAVRPGESILVMDADEGDVPDLEPLGMRVAAWTEAGRTFLAENMREWDAWEQEVAAKGSRKRKATAIFVNWTDRAAFVASIAALGLFLSWIRIVFFNGG